MYQSNIRSRKARSQRDEKKRDIVYPDDGQEYAYVQELMGNGRLKAFCEDGNVRVGRIRGNMRNYKHKVIINRGDIILVSKRDYEPDKLDVIHKYSFEEANKLARQKELPEAIDKLYNNHDECGNLINHNEEDFVGFERSDEPVDIDTI